MLFVGVDFGWFNKPSGLAVFSLENSVLKLRKLERLENPDAILKWIKSECGRANAMIAVDAPLIIPNTTGMRTCDRATHSFFGKYHAGCYPANSARPYAQRTVSFGVALEKMGFQHATEVKPKKPGRYQIEVYPHAAIVQLFCLDRILKYKKGKRENRSRELARLRELAVKSLSEAVPALQLPELEDLPLRGSLKPFEDKLDAIICAYVGAHWWYWGVERNLLLGDEREGYIVVPERQNAALKLTGQDGQTGN